MPISVDNFFLNPAYRGTLQNQIRQLVIEGILEGRFRPGERMPSSRMLATRLGVSRITVVMAYSDLVADDYLVARNRSGFFVSQTAPRPQIHTYRSRSRVDGVDWSRALGQRFSGGVTSMGKPENWRRFRFPFVYGQADPSLFDHQNWRGCTMMALGQKDFDVLTDDHFERDDPELVEYIARHTLPRRGIRARPEEILVTLGAQNALWLSAQVLLNQRRTSAIEEPGYPGLRDILNQSRCRVLPIPIGREGLDPEALPDGIDVLFCSPSHHCPTGRTMPMRQRQTLLSLASRRDFLIVEDDYDFEMAYRRAPFPALKSLDVEGRVIYIGSFSKSLFPGLRLGYLVGPEPFVREARALRGTVLRHPPGLMQRAAAYFLSLGYYDALIRRLGNTFAERKRVALEAINEHGLTVEGEGGSSLWLQTDERIDTSMVARQLYDQSVLIEAGHPFFAGVCPRNYYRLAFSSIPEERIHEGISRIAAILQNALPG
ncbi:PLP-dependent aminotransferase family protein [Chelativorans sp. Marseille-P2723]|uniref:MocR-like pyridoxine biosynthesis transcription factor PdxR n=1 Tax=Chelativorans sp. Marseille-P2723 TaxID=2709133 RepID=UPI00156DB076|nr:PLP-dependent aminotransferase family protein [Chelativorans sp. Marseille-P2723]